jgi:ABC-type multidrug transport system ATPase subunit
MRPAGDTAILLAENLSFSYGERQVFSGWSAEFHPGLTWIRGPNGRGKSTLLQLLGGGLSPHAGKLGVRGIDSAQRPLDYRREVFWFGSGSIAFDHLTPREYFGFMRGLYPRFDDEALHRSVAGFGLEPHRDRVLRHLSSGTQRKIWLTAAFATGTAAVLIDEPVNALDADALAHLHDTLEHGATDSARAWIVTSHEPLGPAGAKARRIALR